LSTRHEDNAWYALPRISIPGRNNMIRK